MKTKSFVLKLNQITTALLSMTPALREAVHQSIRTSQVEMPINELFQPIFDASPSCPHCCPHWLSFSTFKKVGEVR
jgi:hypothetical protein